VTNCDLDPALKKQLRVAFLTTEDDQRTRRILKRSDLSRLVAVSQDDYSLDANKDLAA